MRARGSAGDGAADAIGYTAGALRSDSRCDQDAEGDDRDERDREEGYDPGDHRHARKQGDVVQRPVIAQA
ncbi:MAG: hypothetical protein ACRDK5_09110 [Solirubrobacterales bacterium]